MSSCLLVEESADSEACSSELFDSSEQVTVSFYGDEDDAISSSCFDTADVLFGSDDEEDGDGNRVSVMRREFEKARRASSGICVEDGDEVESLKLGCCLDGGLRKEEMEAMEDREFWETCMAVGYP